MSDKIKTYLNERQIKLCRMLADAIWAQPSRRFLIVSHDMLTAEYMLLLCREILKRRSLNIFRRLYSFLTGRRITDNSVHLFRTTSGGACYKIDDLCKPTGVKFTGLLIDDISELSDEDIKYYSSLLSEDGELYVFSEPIK